MVVSLLEVGAQQVSVPNAQPQRELGPQPEDHSFVVFFGQGDYQYVPQDRIIPFQAGLAKYKTGKSSLDAAVKEAVTHLKAQVVA